MYKHFNLYVYTYTYIYIYTHTYIYIYIYIYVQFEDVKYEIYSDIIFHISGNIHWCGVKSLSRI